MEKGHIKKQIERSYKCRLNQVHERYCAIFCKAIIFCGFLLNMLYDLI